MIYHYIQLFLRNVRKNAFFYSINLGGFIVGFLLLTIISAFVYQELSFDRFHQNASSIYRIHSGGYGVTPLCFKEKLENKIPEITDIVRFSSSGDLKIDFKGEILDLGKFYYTDPEIFRSFSFKLLSGNPDNALQTPFSVVINKTTAQKLFGERSSLGEMIRDINGLDYTVTGVMEDIPYNSHIQSAAFISIETLKNIKGDEPFSCGNWSGLTYIRLAKNSKVPDIENKINSVLEDFRMGTSDGKIPLKLQSLKKTYFDAENNKYDGTKHGRLQTTLLYLAIAVLILIIVIFNYINLTTAILTSRIKEFSIRKIQGAEGRQIIKQIVTETLGVTFLSFFIALLLDELFLPQLSRILGIPVSATLNRAWLYSYYFVIVGVIGVVTGVVPGILFSKTDEIKVLRNENVFGSRGILRRMLLVLQFIIVAVLLNTTFIIKKQIDYVLEKDLGFQYENVVTFDLNEELQHKKELFKNNLLKNSVIENVSFSDGLMGGGFVKSPLTIDGETKLCYKLSVDPAYFDLYKIKLKNGRNFSSDLKTDGQNSCVVNEEVCTVFGLEYPVGKTIGDRKIIGVVGDFNYTSLHNSVEPLVINCGTGKVVQIKISPYRQEQTIAFVKNTCENISPGFEWDYTFLESRITNLYQPELNLKSSTRIYSVIAFSVALLGLFGLTLFTIKKRTKEISIRKLHGARLRDTFWIFFREQIWIVLFSNIIAVPISIFIMNQWLNNFSFRTDIGIIIFFKTFCIALIFSVLAILFLIIKTHRINVVNALKYE